MKNPSNVKQIPSIHPGTIKSIQYNSLNCFVLNPTEMSSMLNSIKVEWVVWFFVQDVILLGIEIALLSIHIRKLYH